MNQQTGQTQVAAMTKLAGEAFKAGDLVDINGLGRGQVTAVEAAGWLRVRTSLNDTISIRAALCRHAV